MSDTVRIFDTTLRDGEQSPGCSMNVKEKLEMAHQLALLGVDILEAGFPIASEGDFEAVKLIAEQVKGPVIAGLARALEIDVKRAGEALKPAQKKRIHTFIATSPVHMEKKLKMSEEQVIDAAVKAVKLARNYTDDIEFSCEDAGRTDWDYMCRIIEATIDAGATTINIPDTVGYCTPWQFGECIKYVREHVPNINKAVISAHCHNDMGMAVSNTLAAIVNGARQAECTINGIGERAGNASLEEIVMNLKTRKDFYKCDTNINTGEIYKTSRLLSRITGVKVQPNKAIVGANAFAHEAGIHQHGVLSDRQTYEIMTPESVGWTGESMVMGKHSGRHALKERLASLGLSLSEDEIDKAFKRFKDLCDKKKEIYDEDLYAIVQDELLTADQGYQLEFLETSSSTEQEPTATVKIRRGEKILEATSGGDGQIDAAYKAIDKIIEHDVKLDEFHIDAVTSGTDAVGQVSVKVSSEGRATRGVGASTDIVLASTKAYLNAINALEL